MSDDLSEAIWDLGQDLNTARNAADIAFYGDLAEADGRSIESCMHKIESLQVELGRQRLLSNALIRFLIQQKIVDAAQLEAFIEQVDAEDGVVDGQSPPDVIETEEPEVNPIAKNLNQSPFGG